MFIGELTVFLRKHYTEKINGLRDWQKRVLNSHEWKMKMNYLYVVGTSGGKTLIMEEAAAELFYRGKGKVMFVFPYVELASEKHQDLMVRFNGLSVKGFYGPSSDSDTSFDDIAVCTPEKAYHIITQSPVDLLLIDEIHLINDPSRGHVVESLVYVAMSCHSLRIIGTTATLTRGDAVVLSNVMRAHLYYDESGQQSQLISYIFNDMLSCTFNGVSSCGEVSNTYILEKMEKNYLEHQSFLSFCITIDNTQSEASNFLAHLRSRGLACTLPSDDSWDMDIRTVEAASPDLASLMKYGIVFHHASLDDTTRNVVSKWIRKRVVRSIFATETLAAGVDLPDINFIYINTLSYGMGSGSPVVRQDVITQMVGRGGRNGEPCEILFNLRKESEKKQFDVWMKGNRSCPLVVDALRLVNLTNALTHVVHATGKMKLKHSYSTRVIGDHPSGKLALYHMGCHLGFITPDVRVTHLGQSILSTTLTPFNLSRLGMLYRSMNHSKFSEYLSIIMCSMDSPVKFENKFSPDKLVVSYRDAISFLVSPSNYPP
jgi:hypothetical protein